VNDLSQILLPVELSGSQGTPSSDRLWFAPPAVPSRALLPNPYNKYMAVFPGDQYQPDRVIVVRGRAPGFPDSYDGSPNWTPSRGFRAVDMRYWSLCEVDGAMPLSCDKATFVAGGFEACLDEPDRHRRGRK
jgi:hypothetical protein